MAIGWMTALKVIPWGDVIEAAPGIVKGARKMFAPSPPTTQDVAASDPQAPWQGQVGRLEAALAQMQEQHQASVQLIESLAEQNAKVVQAIDILRVRTRMLFVSTAVLAVAVMVLAGVLIWGR